MDGWRVGLSGGLTRRANSVLPLGTPPDVTATLDRVEELYAAQGQPSIVRVCRASPRGLDDLLALRDYEVMSRTDVLVRELDGLEPRHRGRPHRRRAGAGRRSPTDRATSGSRPGPARRPGCTPRARRRRRTTRASRLARSVLGGAPAVYLTATDATGLVGVIRAAFAEEWVALSCLVVAHAARRHGLGRFLTERALDEGAQRGARRAFLQVEAENAAAGALYTGLGFQPAERYVYRERR